MITFLPYNDFVLSLRCLDNKRIVKQVIEAYQMWCCLMNISHHRWRNTVMVKIWEGYEKALQLYTILALKEAESRITKKGRNYYMPTMRKHLKNYNFYDLDNVIEYPEWFGDVRFHDSHKAMLYHKNPIYYIDFEQEGKKYSKYYWPL